MPVEAGAKVRDARLRLVYQSADAVRSERSRMWVYLNQQSIAQLPLSGDGDAVRADIVLPPDLLTAGQNTLSLWAQQEGGQGCDAGSSAALWTRLDPGNSYLALETAGPDRERNLADLADAASFIGAGSERIELLTPASPTEGGLKAGALVAQGFALRMPDSGIAVRHRLADAQALAGRNGKVVVGTADKIRGIPGIDDLPEVQGPYIGLRPIQGAGPVLIVSGRTDAEVLKAASAFADPSVALPAATDWNVDAVRPAVPWKRTMQEPGKSYRFKELRAISGGISNGTEARTGLELNLPADTLPAGGRKVLLELDYTYAQNLAPNSVVNVLVNGNYASMIALNDPRGETVGKHRVLLPVDRFRPGMNTIAFEPMIGSDSSTGCLVRPGAGRSIAISGDSTITIPEMARVASLPDLQLFASGGFPYVGTTDPRAGSQRNFEVLLTGSDSGTIGGAWTLLAKLARTAGHPIANFAIGPKAGYQGDVLMIGPADSLDGRIAADLPPAARHVHDAMRPAGSLFQPGSLLQPGLQSGPAARPRLRAGVPKRDQGLHRRRQAGRRGGRVEFADVPDLPGNPVAEPVRPDRRHQLRSDRRAQRHDGRVRIAGEAAEHHHRDHRQYRRGCGSRHRFPGPAGIVGPPVRRHGRLGCRQHVDAGVAGGGQLQDGRYPERLAPAHPVRQRGFRPQSRSLGLAGARRPVRPVRADPCGAEQAAGFLKCGCC